MSNTAERVHTDQAQIARLQARVEELPGESVVELRLVDGTVVTGVVAVGPSVQIFRDAEGREGTNAYVRIDDQEQPERWQYIWLDQIENVTRLGSA